MKRSFVSSLCFFCVLLALVSCSFPSGVISSSLVELPSSCTTINSLSEVKATVLALQNAAYKKGLSALGGQLSDGARSLSDQPTAIDFSCISPEQEDILNSLVAEFNASLPTPPMIFTNGVPSGFAETERFVYCAGVTFDKLDPRMTDILCDLAVIYDHQQRGVPVETDRGVSFSNVAKWPIGQTIRVSINTTATDPSGNVWITPAQANTIYQAVSSWEVPSNRSVTFTRFYPTAWDWFLNNTMVSRFVHVKVGVNDTVAAYTNQVGYAGVNEDLLLCPTWWKANRNFPNSVTPTVAHEMGHLLGLWHEHQRPDRDSFVRLGTKPATMDQASWDFNTQKLETFYIAWQVAWWPIAVGPFDFDSVMIYPSPYVYRLNGAPVYQGSRVSATDGLTVDSMY